MSVNLSISLIEAFTSLIKGCREAKDMINKCVKVERESIKGTLTQFIGRYDILGGSFLLREYISLAIV
jgi:hypothetical protein